MSQQVLWEVVKGNNAFLVKRNGLTLSTDPFNNTGVQTYSSTGFISKNAVGVVSTQGKVNQINNINLVAKKSTKFQQADRKAKNTQSVYASTLAVKHGVHTASRVIRKRFGTSRLGSQKAALRKLVKLNRANAVRRRNELAAAKAQKK
ncbi:unnamed protein product (macronuclear) [Paramecium tetraurelia]|uniref:Ribosomal eL28/Mak16 domain-containing protein n=1 Tax=Paramecium tetraurelia TaxID=5888 RepID=A0C5U4_PARTE|nr:uncharacterized protein GSPATT00035290001 [Paramecium tetraurelia]CAK66161.1 unnamed protein product [Paramecium tetraurelia]|eukprot:XP_001433558.1 hypothetical protein (macronuclear) [Paramecium tetraurelia strain d4-2]